MERLTRRDLRSLFDCLREVYAIRSLSAFPACVISTLRRVVPTDIISYNEVNVGLQRFTTLTEPREAINFPDGLEIFRQHIPEHPLIAYYGRTRDGRARKISDLVTQSQFHQSGLYSEFFRKVKVEHQMAFTLPVQPPLLIGIALNRSRSDFTERDRLCLDLLRPHLIQAYRNAEAFTEGARRLVLLEQAMDAGGLGVVILTREEHVRFATPQAQRWLAKYFSGPRQRGGRLPETLRRWVRHQEALFAGGDDIPLRSEPLRVERQGTQLVVRLLCEPGQNFLILEERLTAVRPGALESFGLTRREAEVLAWVAEGKTNAEIGRIFGTSPRTVAKHLEHVYQKLGVETRTAAARLAFTVPAAAS
jgi:DNA-binding CsgD family transcriptional regulator